MFSPDIEAAARAHALAQYPNESCGVVAGGVYVALPNVAADPRETFQLPADALVAHGPAAAVVHSHCAPRHGREPSSADMAAQIETALPFGIVHSDGQHASGPLWFGDFVLDEPLVGRAFCHGVRDCYALIRAYFWQHGGVKLIDIPRQRDWWAVGGDLYVDHMGKVSGVVLIDAAAARPGDVFLMKIEPRAKGPHHGGILLEGGLALHHLQDRLSRREPIHAWRKFITHWLRYEA